MSRFSSLLLAIVISIGSTTLVLGVLATPASAQETTEVVEAPETVSDNGVPETTVEEVEPVTAFVKLIEGVQNKDWLLVTACALMLFIWVWNVFILPRLISGDKHPKWKKASPWISIGIAVVAQFSTAVIAGNSLTDALNTAVMMGFTASGMWSSAGKYAGNYVEKKINGKPKVKSLPVP